MSLTFKFDKSNENNPDKGDNKPMPGAAKDIERYDTTGQVRNICFVELSCKQTFLSYAYLTSAEFSPEDNKIVLFFTSHTVTLKGNGLADVYEDLKTYNLKQIKCVDKRYVETLPETKASVTEINIKQV
ncbi:MAG: hypothetical protein JSR97_01155 [Verrucomicrobia bacterium]|nr:hypothetical protein [Verrucomicrobiota bacterium]